MNVSVTGKIKPFLFAHFVIDEIELEKNDFRDFLEIFQNLYHPSLSNTCILQTGSSGTSCKFGAVTSGRSKFSL